MSALALTLLGAFDLTRDGQRLPGPISAKGRALLAYLAVEAHRPHAREVVAELLWPDHGPHVARDSLRQALATLRQALGERTAAVPVLLITRDTLQFNLTADVEVDVAAFAVLHTACVTHRHERLDRCPFCMRRFQQLAALYRGEFLDPVPVGASAAFEEWAALQRERLRRQALEVLAHLATYNDQRGAYGEARAYAERQLELDPWAEQAHRHVMRTLALTGQRSAALEHYDWCRRTLAEDLGVEPAVETTALFQQIQAGTLPTPPLPPARHAAPLPVHGSSFIGRDDHRAALARSLKDPGCHLLTVTGPGGVGKSRLALQVARDLQHAFADGVQFVPLAPVSDAALVVPAIAQVLGVRERPDQALELTVQAALRNQHLLLVLDNCEHVLGAAVQVAALLQAAPALTVLATSRAPLRLSGEQQYAVPPLTLPDSRHADVTAQVAQSEAGALFIARAQAVQRAFAPTATTAPAIAAICHRLDGLPLAIELAAARISVLSPPDLLHRLELLLPVLTGGGRDLPPRQQTIRATIDWSYCLLAVPEQALFRRLGVFVGGFTLAAAEAVCSTDGAAAGDLVTVDGVQRLSDTSLLQQRAGVDDEPRFVMLETVREYALERLAASGEGEPLRERHCAFYIDLATRAAQAAPRVGGARWIERLDVAYGNLRAALRWAIDSLRVDLALAGVAALGGYWIYRALHTEARLLIDAALALPAGADSQLRTRALLEASYVLYQAADFAAARARAQEAWHLAEGMDDRAHMARALLLLGKVAAVELDYTTALTHYQQSHVLRSELGDTVGLSECAYALGDMAGAAGDAEQARAWYAESESLARATGDVVGQAAAQCAHAASLELAGDTTTARRLYEDALTSIQQHRIRNVVTWICLGLASVDLAEDDAAAARLRAHEQLTLCRRHGLVWESVICHKILGLAAFAERDDRTAHAHYEQGMEVAEAHGLRDLHDQLMLCMAKLELNMGSVADGATWLRDYLAAHDHTAQHYPEDVAVFVEAVAWLVERMAATASAQPTALRDVATLLGSAAARRGHLQAQAYPFLRALNAAVLNQCRRHLDEVDMQAAWIHGQNLTQHEALAWASRVLDQVTLDQPAERSVVDHHAGNEPDCMERG